MVVYVGAEEIEAPTEQATCALVTSLWGDRGVRRDEGRPRFGLMGPDMDWRFVGLCADACCKMRGQRG